MIDDRALARLLESEIPDLVAAYRFGSTARGDERSDSDVDVAVLARAQLPGRRLLDLMAAIAEVVRREVDVVDLRTASTVLRMQVVGQGIPLPVGDASARGAFEDRVYQDYVRLNEERRDILEQIAREGTIRG